MIAKQGLIDIAKKEFATTLRVMNAYPSDKPDFTPHERSSNAMKLMSTFVFEAYLLDGYLFGGSTDPYRFKDYQPDGISGVIADFEGEAEKILQDLEAIPEEDLAKTVTFAGKDYVADAFALMMIHDQIHHRGQLSVYVRMAGGKVPSIYGPSADDASTNL